MYPSIPRSNSASWACWILWLCVETVHTCVIVCADVFQYDATLPEFNHVMLNHLYALSIKVIHLSHYSLCILRSC